MFFKRVKVFQSTIAEEIRARGSRIEPTPPTRGRRLKGTSEQGLSYQVLAGASDLTHPLGTVTYFP